MSRHRWITPTLIATAIFGAGVLLGTFGLQRTTTSVVVRTRTVTVDAPPSSGQTLHVQILDAQPRLAGTTDTDTPFPFDQCHDNAHFPRPEDVAVYEPATNSELGTLVGLADNATVSYSPAGDTSICAMDIDVPDLAPARFYIVHADSEFRQLEGGYNWRLSATELERNDWSIRLRLPE